MYNVGDKVEYTESITGESKIGEILSIDSDRYDKLKVEDGKLEYWSKKTKKFRPVKDFSSIFFEVASNKNVFSEFILLEEINVTC